MSGTVIVTKYSTGTGSPATNALAVGEQAYSFSSDKLFIGQTVWLECNSKNYRWSVIHRYDGSHCGYVNSIICNYSRCK